MTPSNRKTAERGSTLILALVLLGVLSVIGVAAVALSSQERTNASTKSSRDRLVACAKAAQGNIWAEMLRYGPSFTTSARALPEIRLDDGTVLRGGHYGNNTGMVVMNTGARTVPCKQNETEEFVDLTNRDSYFTTSGACYLIIARCVDSQGRELEVEFGINTLF
jgi:hypothetical protein